MVEAQIWPAGPEFDIYDINCHYSTGGGGLCVGGFNEISLLLLFLLMLGVRGSGGQEVRRPPQWQLSSDQRPLCPVWAGRRGVWSAGRSAVGVEWSGRCTVGLSGSSGSPER